jgi:hypothetical protein
VAEEEEKSLMSKESKIDPNRLVVRNVARELTAEEMQLISGAQSCPKDAPTTSTCAASDGQRCDLDYHDRGGSSAAFMMEA